MKEIKFRGVTTHGGQYVYGDLSHYNGNTFINDRRVFETSVAQFIGLDDNGDEIYDADLLTDKDGNEYYAELAVVCYSNFDSEQSRFQYFNEVKTINLTLKKGVTHETN